MAFVQPEIDLSPKVSDEIRKTTCYMCACRCGINVHMKDDKVAYIEGNRDHPVNKGVLCAKGSAGIMQVNAPSRLRAPSNAWVSVVQVSLKKSLGMKRCSWHKTGWSRSIKKTQKNWLFSRAVISHKVLHRFGRKVLEHQTMQHMVDFVQ